MSPTDELRLVDVGTARFVRHLDRWADDLRAPSLLPGWTRAHVAVHVARNAEALDNLLTWARTGTETPMYASPEARVLAIEAGLRASDADIVSAVRRTAEALAAHADGLLPAAWSTPVRTATGRVVPATIVPWLRVREVWIHATDLGPGASFDELPPELVERLLADVADNLGSRPGIPPLHLQADDRPWRATLGDEPATTVRGPAPALLGWLLGRTTDRLEADGPRPALPPWL